jgi:nitroreductase
VFLVIENQDLKEKIYQEACQQPQIKESSHVLVFAAWRNAGDAEVDEYINRVASTRGIDREKLADFEIMVRNAVNYNTPEQNANWFARQAYIGLGFGLTAAAVEKVDSTPMEGFNADAMDKVLGLAGSNLHTTCVLTLGYRDEKTDYLVNAKKVRRSKTDLFVFK